MMDAAEKEGLDVVMDRLLELVLQNCRRKSEDTEATPVALLEGRMAALASAGRIFGSKLATRLAEEGHRLNDLRPIRRLPPDVLISTFSLVVDNEAVLHYYGKLENLARVCRLWRSVIRGTPSFWTRISWQHPAALISTALSLSRAAPLDLEVHPLHPEHDADVALAIAPIFSALHRWRSVSMSAEDESTVVSFFGSPLPSLTSVKLRALFIQSTVMPILQEAPRLRQIALDGCPIAWDSSVLSQNLTSLELSWTEGIPVSMERFIAIVACCPCLRILALLAVEFSDYEYSGRVVDLYHLEKLQLRDVTPSPSRALLENLRPNKDNLVFLKVKLDCREVRELDDEEVADRLMGLLANLISRCERLSISVGEFGGGTLYVGVNNTIGGPDASDVVFCVELNELTSELTSELIKSISVPARNLPATQYVYLNGRAAEDTLLEWIPWFPCITCLQLAAPEDQFKTAVFEALSSPTFSPDGTQWMLPKLKCIDYHGMASDGPNQWEALLNMLYSRYGIDPKWTCRLPARVDDVRLVRFAGRYEVIFREIREVVGEGFKEKVISGHF